MLESFQTLLQFCGIISLSLAVPSGFGKLTGRRKRRLAKEAAYEVLIAHMLDHHDAWDRLALGGSDYTLTCGKLKVAFSFSYRGEDLNHCQVNGETISNSVGWKLHRAYTGGDTDLSHVIVRSLRPQTPLMLASVPS